MNDGEIVRALRAAAAKWEAKNKFIGTGELRVHDALNDAADLIESLQAQLAESQRREKAAVEDWRGICAKCSKRDKQYLSDGQMDAVCATCRANGKCNWEWRGQQAGKGEHKWE